MLVAQYDKAIHLLIRMAPVEASRRENENKVWRNLYPDFGGKTLTLNFQLCMTLTLDLVKVRSNCNGKYPPSRHFAFK